MEAIMSTESIVDDVKEIISEILEIEVESLSDTERKISEITHVDSIHVLDMVAAVEKKFKISIAEDDFVKMSTIGSVAGLVMIKKNYQAS